MRLVFGLMMALGLIVVAPAFAQDNAGDAPVSQPVDNQAAMGGDIPANQAAPVNEGKKAKKAKHAKKAAKKHHPVKKKKKKKKNQDT